MRRSWRRRSVLGWVLFGLGVVWVILAQAIQPALATAWSAVSSVPAGWYQAALIIVGLAWVAFVALRPDRGERTSPETTQPAGATPKRPGEVLVEFLTAQRDTLKSFATAAQEVESRLLWSPDVPSGIDPGYAQQQKMEDDYREVDKWMRMVSTHLRQHVTSADRYFAMPPDGGTPKERLACYVSRLLDVIRDVEAMMEHAKRRL